MLKMKMEVAEQLKDMVSNAAQQDLSAKYIAQHACIEPYGLYEPGSDCELWQMLIGNYESEVWCHIDIYLNTKDPSKSTVEHHFSNSDSDGDCLSWM